VILVWDLAAPLTMRGQLAALPIGGDNGGTFYSIAGDAGGAQELRTELAASTVDRALLPALLADLRALDWGAARFAQAWIQEDAGAGFRAEPLLPPR
jgi:hypothetical protein